jgi:predicted nucleotidyltransferase
MKVARVATSEAFEMPKDATGTAEGYFDALEKAYASTYGETLSLGPNDILGVEYSKAILRGGFPIKPVAVKRVGDGFHATATGETPFASATALRTHLREKGTDGLAAYMPTAAVELLDRAVADKTAPVDVKRIESAVLSFFRLTSPESLSDIAELGNGLEYRLCEAALKAGTLDEFFSLAATKKYTDSRSRRAVLFAMTGVMRHDLKTLPQYTTLLAANAEGREVLSQLRKKENVISVVTKPADGKSVSERQYTLSYLLDCLFTLAMPTPTEAGAFMRKGAIID